MSLVFAADPLLNDEEGDDGGAGGTGGDVKNIFETLVRKGRWGLGWSPDPPTSHTHAPHNPPVL